MKSSNMAEQVAPAEHGRNIETIANAINHGDEGKDKEHSFLKKILNKTFRIRIADGRTLIGTFLCTDKDQNIVLGQCQEYVKSNGPESGEEARILGLAMIPGRHIVSIDIDTHVAEFKNDDKPNSCFKLESIK